MSGHRILLRELLTEPKTRASSDPCTDGAFSARQSLRHKTISLWPKRLKIGGESIWGTMTHFTLWGSQAYRGSMRRWAIRKLGNGRLWCYEHWSARTVKEVERAALHHEGKVDFSLLLFVWSVRYLSRKSESREHQLKILSTWELNHSGSVAVALGKSF